MAAVKELLKHPAINVNYQSKHGENALFEAVSYKRKDIVDLLLSHPQCRRFGQDGELDASRGRLQQISPSAGHEGGPQVSDKENYITASTSPATNRN